ncbi:hypothetical protein TTHERM_000463609 (macronuclear) [Tetrahymena thermophila SB210]|uniref:Uncharacterized protein n=1 Tax=Tetrahymena thermophila (strain SB210) TaxID=312017 RepID=W7XIY7_TETTS|nr:hypothetical protein TTHERM_000463609 [Tetrahymena thermophila SB210]EWS73714.1 hypothetical protein TTHERM_000463609 [Tetrahymena thermophila SB210]|eukprot:XP_012653752.1 hypothetical protein TTHERM_000463609 [Tetrahymena thermophila SB210]
MNQIIQYTKSNQKKEIKLKPKKINRINFKISSIIKSKQINCFYLRSSSNYQIKVNFVNAENKANPHHQSIYNFFTLMKIQFRRKKQRRKKNVLLKQNEMCNKYKINIESNIQQFDYKKGQRQDWIIIQLFKLNNVKKTMVIYKNEFTGD